MVHTIVKYIGLAACFGLVSTSAFGERGDKNPVASPSQDMPKPEASMARPAHPIDGLWITSKGRSRVEIKACDTKLCNEIVWLKEPLTTSGLPKYDGRNKNEKLRKLKRPIIGLTILLNTSLVKPNLWKGKIYDPERGKAYSATITLVSKTKLLVKGCLDWGFPCETHLWKRFVPPPVTPRERKLKPPQ